MRPSTLRGGPQEVPDVQQASSQVRLGRAEVGEVHNVGARRSHQRAARPERADGEGLACHQLPRHHLGLRRRCLPAPARQPGLRPLPLAARLPGPLHRQDDASGGGHQRAGVLDQGLPQGEGGRHDVRVQAGQGVEDDADRPPQCRARAGAGADARGERRRPRRALVRGLRRAPVRRLRAGRGARRPRVGAQRAGRRDRRRRQQLRHRELCLGGGVP
mmetsp:Transcript_90377/g.233262  ORF Transcript_90377/g.233262 Transcript_90377/m.233262 type:complete len:217 (-) Transcript_90377:159-809(-)